MKKDPPQLKRLRNALAPGMPCGEFLGLVLDRAPTISEAAEELGVTRETVWRWRKGYRITESIT